MNSIHTSFFHLFDNEKYTLRSDLPDFSFLTIQILERYGNDFLSGVIAHNGVVLNEDGIDKFEIKTTDTSFDVTLCEELDSEPTVIAFPNWLGKNEEDYPAIVTDLTHSISDITSSGFKINHANERKLSSASLGFNFLVIGSNIPTKDIKHGIIYDCAVPIIGTTTKHGIEVVTEAGCPFGSGGPVRTHVNRGVLIKFDTPFSHTPSVIASPVYDGDDVTRCFVESITKFEARVKCGRIDSNEDYHPISFAFVAVGDGSPQDCPTPSPVPITTLEPTMATAQPISEAPVQGEVTVEVTLVSAKNVHSTGEYEIELFGTLTSRSATKNHFHWDTPEDDAIEIYEGNTKNFEGAAIKLKTTHTISGSDSLALYGRLVEDDRRRRLANDYYGEVTHIESKQDLVNVYNSTDKEKDVTVRFNGDGNTLDIKWKVKATSCSTCP